MAYFTKDKSLFWEFRLCLNSRKMSKTLPPSLEMKYSRKTDLNHLKRLLLLGWAEGYWGYQQPFQKRALWVFRCESLLAPFLNTLTKICYHSMEYSIPTGVIILRHKYPWESDIQPHEHAYMEILDTEGKLVNGILLLIAEYRLCRSRRLTRFQKVQFECIYWKMNPFTNLSVSIQIRELKLCQYIKTVPDVCHCYQGTELPSFLSIFVDDTVTQNIQWPGSITLIYAFMVF